VPGSILEGTGVSTANSETWIEDGEKYSLVGLDVKTEGTIPKGELAAHLFVLTDTAFQVPGHWREWLGSIRADEVKNCNIFLVSKLRSMRPEVLDDENKSLQQRVWNFFVGLLLASTFATAHKPVLISGSRRAGEIDIRQQTDLDSPIPCIFRPYPPVLARDFKLAARLAAGLENLTSTPLPGGHWRLFRTLHIYCEARTTQDILERLHQYARCIDGLILPDPGQTKKQFKSRTELFIGPRQHDVMGEIYDVRSAVEHLHENRYLEGFDRETRLDLVKKEAFAEHVARTSLARVIGNASLWTHFANTSSLASFWALLAADRRQIWGDPIDLLEAVVDFDPKHIHDGHLGGS
jgi:hypothetical protein